MLLRAGCQVARQGGSAHPIPIVPIAMPAMASTIARLRPCVSPMWPNSSAPTGRAAMDRPKMSPVCSKAVEVRH